MKRSLTALVLAAAASLALAQDKSAIDKVDKNFIEKAAAGGMLEVQWGQLAETKAQNPDIKTYAAMLVKDHTAANDELKALAQSKGVTMPTALPRHEQGQLDKLGKAKNFDQEFVEENIEDHKKDVKDFEKASQSAKDPEVKAFAAKTLPTLKAHLQQAESLQKSVKARKS